ncbi:hypothetical protein ES705_48379 [subsurface metagenome]
MKLYIDTKKMTFEEEANGIIHEIILKVLDEKYLCYDYIVKLPDDDKFIEDTLEIEYEKDKEGNNTEEIKSKMFHVREKATWWNFPLYEIVNGEIVDFDYTKYQYFVDTDRRMILAKKINKLYNPSSEAKILRKILKIIVDKLDIECPEFQKYYNKIGDIINRNPK